MNNNRIAPIIGAAALLLTLSACAGVAGQNTDTARAESSQARLEAKIGSVVDTRVADLLREVKQAEAQASRTERGGSVDMAVQERIRAAKQQEAGATTVAVGSQELVRQVKQAESEQSDPGQGRPVKPSER